MRLALLLLCVLPVGCVSNADFQPPAGHPASASAAAEPNPPRAADPFVLDAEPIEPASEPVARPHAGRGDHAAGPAVCPVSGAPLGSMGKPVDVVLDGGTVRVCCPACVAAVEADPAAYLAAEGGHP